jgi:tetratricopeptide (TPR) repeat protein
MVFSIWHAVRATHALAAESNARREAEAAHQKAEQEAQNARDQAAIAQAVNDFLNQGLLAEANPLLSYGRFNEPIPQVKLLAVLDRAASQAESRFVDRPLVEAAVQQTLGRMFSRLKQTEKSRLHFQRAIELYRKTLGNEQPDTLACRAELAFETGDLGELSRVLDSRRSVLGTDHSGTLDSMFLLAMATRLTADATGSNAHRARSIVLFRETLEAQQRVLGEEHVDAAWTMHCLAHTLMLHADSTGNAAENDQEIEHLFRVSLAVYRKKLPDTWHTYDITLRLGQFLRSRHRFEEAEALLSDAIARLESLPGAPPEMAAELTAELSETVRSRNQSKSAADAELAPAPEEQRREARTAQ